MSTIYTQHPAGYPQTVYAIEGRAGSWWVTRDCWDAPTTHSGAVRVAGPFGTRAEAQTSIDAADRAHERVLGA